MAPISLYQSGASLLQKRERLIIDNFMSYKLFVLLLFVCSESDVFGQVNDYIPKTMESIDYYEFGKETAEKDYLPWVPGILGFSGGLILGPVGWSGVYGITRWMGERKIKVPMPQNGLTVEEKQAFARGYKEGVKLKRRSTANEYGMFGTVVLIFIILNALDAAVGATA